MFYCSECHRDKPEAEKVKKGKHRVICKSCKNKYPSGPQQTKTKRKKSEKRGFEDVFEENIIYVSVSELARETGLHAITIRGHIKAGRLKAILFAAKKQGGSPTYYIRQNEAKRYINENKKDCAY